MHAPTNSKIKIHGLVEYQALGCLKLGSHNSVPTDGADPLHKQLLTASVHKQIKHKYKPMYMNNNPFQTTLFNIARDCVAAHFQENSKFYDFRSSYIRDNRESP